MSEPDSTETTNGVLSEPGGAEPLEAFRDRCRRFLDEHAKGIDYPVGQDRATASIAAAKAFQFALTEAGLAGLTYPKEFGGQGLEREYDRVWREEYGNYPDMSFELTISHGMCLPVLNQFGTDEQKRQFLARNISGADIWCQMFSEPGAGSDVASLQTKAELDGDEWIINGQKVWTTLAHVSDYGIVIARTNPDVPKHAGISMFIIDMRNPGIEIRPIHQIDGGSHFNEVFFTDARIPAGWLVGELNNGWSQATAMLMYERVAIGTGATSGVTTPISDRFIAEAKKRGTSADPVVRQHLMRLYSQEVTKSLVSMRTRAELQAGRAPGPGGSLGKLHGAKIATMVRAITGDVVGVDLTAWASDTKGDQWARGVLTAFQANIAGGTDEIQKNIIGDRVLGLPREPSADRDVAFKDLRVGTQRRAESP